MKYCICNSEMTESQKEILFTAIEEKDLKVVFLNGLTLVPKKFVSSPEFIIDLAMKNARMDTVLTPDATEEEICDWHENIKLVDAFLDKFDKIRMKVKFQH